MPPRRARGRAKPRQKASSSQGRGMGAPHRGPSRRAFCARSWGKTREIWPDAGRARPGGGSVASLDMGKSPNPCSWGGFVVQHPHPLHPSCPQVMPFASSPLPPACKEAHGAGTGTESGHRRGGRAAFSPSPSLLSQVWIPCTGRGRNPSPWGLKPRSPATSWGFTLSPSPVPWCTAAAASSRHPEVTSPVVGVSRYRQYRHGFNFHA